MFYYVPSPRHKRDYAVFRKQLYVKNSKRISERMKASSSFELQSAEKNNHENDIFSWERKGANLNIFKRLKETGEFWSEQQSPIHVPSVAFRLFAT